jgi:hypothetical protein
MRKKNPSAAITGEIEFFHGGCFGSFGDGGTIKVGAFLYTFGSSFELFHSLLVPEPFVG